MPSTPRLLLAVLAVAGGRVTGEMTCYDASYHGYYMLQDTARCWAPELNAAFEGKMDGCDGDGTVSAQPLHLAWGVCVVCESGCKPAAWTSLFSILEAERELKKSRWGRERGEEK